MLYELERTTNFRFQYTKASLRLKRFIDEALDIIKETPTDFQSKIYHMAGRKDKHLYRFRIPGAYIHYMVHDEEPLVTLTQITMMR